MKKIKNKFNNLRLVILCRKLKWIAENYDNHIRELDSGLRSAERIATSAEQVVRERTDIHADVHVRGHNQFIVVGRYKKRDYVQVFSVLDQDFNHMVDQLKHMQRSGVVRTLDAPQGFKGVFERDVKF